MFVEAQQLVAATWVVAAFVLVGLGLLERRLFGPPLRDAAGLWQVFWIGWALLLTGLQLWHVFLPVDDRTRVAVVVVALLGWLAAGTALWRALAASLPRSILPAAASLAAAWWLTNQSLAGPRFGDTGMYLIPTVHWYESYASVPGLANLFVPLGHNLSYFLWAALLDGGPLAGHLYHVVNSTLVVALVARGLFACFHLVTGSRERVASDLFHALALVPISDFAFSLYLTSPMPDAGVYLFGLVMAGELAGLLEQADPSRAAMIRVVFLSAVGLTLKLSIAGLSLATGGVALLWWLWRTRPSPAAAVEGGALALLSTLVPVGTWVVRNSITSGYPLYPAPLLPLPVDWIAKVDATAWIQAPMALAPLWTIFSQWSWWHTRLLSLGWMEPDATKPLALVAGAAALLAVAWPLERLRGVKPALPLVVALAPVAAFFFCFVNTPMPRYQGATLWILAIDLAVVALSGVVARGAVPLRALVVAGALAGAWMPLHRGAEPWLALQAFEPSSPPRLHEQTLASGLTVRVPENQVCWYAELPCTPEPHPGLRLRVPGDLGSGFAIDLPETGAAGPGSGAGAGAGH